MTVNALDRYVARLYEIAQRPENIGRQWTWVDVSIALDVSVPVAQKVVVHWRNTIIDQYWTVPTFSTGYTSRPVTSAEDALPGLINQLKHLLTRLESQQKAWHVISLVDPDKTWQKIARREDRWHERQAGEVADKIEFLLDLSS
jgi:hypothetical protein